MNSLPLLISTIAAPVLALGTLNHLPGEASKYHHPSSHPLPPPVLPQPDGQIWVKINKQATIKFIAHQLGISLSEISKINDQPSGNSLKPGSWIVLPVSAKSRLKRSQNLDIASVSPNPPPVTAPAPPSSVVKIQSGDSIASIAKQHGQTHQRIRQLNPGLEFNQLTVGGNIRVAKAKRPQKRTLTTSLGSNNLESLSLISNGVGWIDLGDTNSYIWPTKGVITSGYGWRWGRMHQGIDIANKVNTPILSAKGGIVSYAGWKGAYGYLVEIAHVNGDSTLYAHNNRLLVKKGQILPQGVTIATMGSTGRSTGPHLHFEIRKKSGTAINPATLLPSKIVTIAPNLHYCYHHKSFHEHHA
ncbi:MULTISPECIES: peptidoglycan DD-metalloendopeptidase family protein [Prochlorococcus]|uniref:peptidoglycan DD-metalloendopeptidase family protein n=1 Tax=Prochlorococcus TaxID=1218 RepID=UPI0007B3993A|nr:MULTISPECIES: M23 family metallopeptidase [Prochlorococcus]NMP06448.1 peptidoglycan DD-metalloendopeptidase family protein [Prochlorococcus sp. P1361]NMP14027.1 peptidoglycan DD-metalloendopeptidase family protein [Prochlorococcus sp.P1363]KZR60873.1 Murein DD-endopeptidase MepM [Prochlorococcus marinus str. MIT 1312]KZR79729.1 Murein DD-endopeptidase MepM [Prochlorococcus marinus str. MIT 1327]NMO83223.1 peptidoglycan DD-metalloendopeptidase family protein [Prochlorococcus sp. P1344]